MNYDEAMTLEARLAILQELDAQGDNRLSEQFLEKALVEVYGHRRRSREWLRTQLRKLEDIGAIKIIDTPSFLVAEITRAGSDHVERVAYLDGVARPPRFEN